MGMFGAIGQYLSNPDNLATLGATLKDTVGAFNGEDSNNIQLLQQQRQARQKLADQAAVDQQLAGIMGASGAGPSVNAPAAGGDDTLVGGTSHSGGLNINDPRLPALVLRAQRAGRDLGPLLEVLKAQKPDAPRVIEGPNGIYRETPDHAFTMVQPYAPPVPFGWELGPDGNPRPRPGGPADPAYIAKTAGVRRDAIVSRPTPSRAAPKAVNPNAIKWD